VNDEQGEMPGGAKMVDVAFALSGGSIMADYAWRLWLGVSERLPWLDEDAAAGIHPLAGVSGSDGALYLNRRAKLILRIARKRIGSAQALAGATLDLGGAVTVQDDVSVRQLLPAAVLYAPFVCVECDDEAAFIEECRRRLPESGGEMICGKARSAARGEGTVRGYSLMLHGLQAEESIALQRFGLGEERRLGCGIFVPHKSVAAVGS
jgi:CRISPR-associated protein Cas6